jgi:hypothetical protein
VHFVTCLSFISALKVFIHYHSLPFRSIRNCVIDRPVTFIYRNTIMSPRQGQKIHPTSASRPALGPTQPPVQWVPGALSLGVKHGRTTHPLLVSCLRKSRSYTSFPPSISKACRGTILLYFTHVCICLLYPPPFSCISLSVAPTCLCRCIDLRCWARLTL